MKQSSAQNPAIFHQHVKATDLVLHREFFPPFLTALHALKKSNFKDRRRLETNWHSTENKIELFSGFCRTTALESFSSTQGCEGLNKRGLTNFLLIRRIFVIGKDPAPWFSLSKLCSHFSCIFLLERHHLKFHPEVSWLSLDSSYFN